MSPNCIEISAIRKLIAKRLGHYDNNKRHVDSTVDFELKSGEKHTKLIDDRWKQILQLCSNKKMQTWEYSYVNPAQS
jgi:hypothetical protein